MLWSQSENYTILLSLFFRKNSVKSTFSLTILENVDFTELLWKNSDSKIEWFPHCVWCGGIYQLKLPIGHIWISFGVGLTKLEFTIRMEAFTLCKLLISRPKLIGRKYPLVLTVIRKSFDSEKNGITSLSNYLQAISERLIFVMENRQGQM